MKYSVITLMFLASTVATVALAQDGNGHGPPNAPVIVPNPATLPTLPVPTGSPKFHSAHVGTSFDEITQAISFTFESRRRGLQLA